MKTIRRFWVNITTCRAPSDHPYSYSHWYCQKTRGHARRHTRPGYVSQAKVHRYNNYVWVDGQYPVHSPMPVDLMLPDRSGLEPRVLRPAPRSDLPEGCEGL